MIKIQKNVARHTVPILKDDSLPFHHPIKTIKGFYNIEGSNKTGIHDYDQAVKIVDSLVGTEVMFDIVLHADTRMRISGHMYAEGSYGSFILMSFTGIYIYRKADGVWQSKQL